MDMNIRRHSLITLFISLISYSSLFTSHSMYSKPISKITHNSCKFSRNYAFQSNLHSNQRAHNQDQKKTLHLFNEIYNFNNLRKNNNFQTSDIVNSFYDDYNKFIEGKKFIKKSNKSQYNANSSNIFKLNIINYVISLDSNYAFRKKYNVKWNKRENCYNILKEWNNKNYILLIDASNFEKSLKDITLNIVNLDLNNNLISLNEFSKLENNDEELQVQIQDLLNCGDISDNSTKMYEMLDYNNV